MTVAELIKQLQELPPETKVVTINGDCDDISYANGFQWQTVYEPFENGYLSSGNGVDGAFQAIEIV